MTAALSSEPDRSVATLADQAIDLAATKGDGGTTELLERAGHDRAALEHAQRVLATRLSRRSDDFEATHGLQLVNRALAQIGWPDPLTRRLRR